MLLFLNMLFSVGICFGYYTYETETNTITRIVYYNAGEIVQIFYCKQAIPDETTTYSQVQKDVFLKINNAGRIFRISSDEFRGVEKDFFKNSVQKTHCLKNNGVTRIEYLDAKGAVEKIGYQPDYKHILQIEWYYYNLKTEKYSKLDAINGFQTLPDSKAFDALKGKFESIDNAPQTGNIQTDSNTKSWCTIQ